MFKLGPTGFNNGKSIVNMKVGPGLSYEVGKQDTSVLDVLVLFTFILGLVLLAVQLSKLLNVKLKWLTYGDVQWLHTTSTAARDE